MGKLGKETKNLLLAITVICLISFLLAAGLSFLLAKDFQHEMLLHDYGVSGYQLNHEDKLQISAFTAHPNESDIERGKEALASIGYSEATSMQLLPTVREYRNQTMLYLFLLKAETAAVVGCRIPRLITAVGIVFLTSAALWFQPKEHCGKKFLQRGFSRLVSAADHIDPRPEHDLFLMKFSEIFYIGFF